MSLKLFSTLDDFDRVARATIAMSYRCITMDVKDKLGNNLELYHGYDQMALNVEALYDIRACMESPAVRGAFRTIGDNTTENIQPDDLENLKGKLVAQFGAAVWREVPLTPEHVMEILMCTDQRLQDKLDYVMSFPTSIRWVFEEDTAEDTLKEVATYKWTCGLSRLQSSMADILSNRFGEAYEVHIDFRALERPTELTMAQHDIMAGGPVLNKSSAMKATLS